MAVNTTVYTEDTGFKLWDNDNVPERFGIDVRRTINLNDLLMDKNENIDDSISLWGLKDTNPQSTIYLGKDWIYKDGNDVYEYEDWQKDVKFFGVDVYETVEDGRVKFLFPSYDNLSFSFDNNITIAKNTYNALTNGNNGSSEVTLEYNNYPYESFFYWYESGMDKLEIHPDCYFRKWLINENKFDEEFGEKHIYFKDINNYINMESGQNDYKFIITSAGYDLGIRVEENFLARPAIYWGVAPERYIQYNPYYQFSSVNFRFQALLPFIFEGVQGYNTLPYHFNIYQDGSANIYRNESQHTTLQRVDVNGDYVRVVDVPYLTVRHVPLNFKVSDYFNFTLDNYKEFYIPPSDDAAGWYVKIEKLNDNKGDYLHVAIQPNRYSLKLYHDILCNFGVKLNPNPELKPTSYENYWWPVLDGQYISGTWAKGVIEANKQTTTIDYNNSAYKPNPSPDGPGPSYTDPTESGVIDNVPSLSGLSFFSNLYALSYSALKNMSATLYSADDAKMQEFIDGLKLMGANPIDAIVSIRLYPFSFDAVSYTNVNFWQKGISSIRFGRTELTMSEEVYKASGFGSILLNCGSIVVRGKHNNFLDYEPFSKVTLWLPYVGFVNLSFSEIADRELSVRYFVDLLTGSAMACVYINNNLYTNIQTQLSIELPITATQNSSKSITTALSLVKSTANLVTSPLTAATDTINTASQALLTSNSTNFQTKGNYNSNLYQMCDQRVLLIHETPEILNEDYQEINGYVLNETRTVGEFSGFCTFENVQINCDGTEDEKRQIKEILESGVYL